MFDLCIVSVKELSITLYFFVVLNQKLEGRYNVHLTFLVQDKPLTTHTPLYVRVCELDDNWNTSLLSSDTH